MGLNHVLSGALMGPLQYGGLAPAASLAAGFNRGLLGISLRRRLGSLYGKAILWSAGKVLSASVVAMMLAGWLAGAALAPWGSSGMQAAWLGAIVLGGVVCDGALMLTLHSEEAEFLVAIARRRLRCR
jgi:peptidoglycan biosynthesis protein MviN/MurJ (putative lipid II flippase)